MKWFILHLHWTQYTSRNLSELLNFYTTPLSVYCEDYLSMFFFYWGSMSLRFHFNMIKIVFEIFYSDFANKRTFFSFCLCRQDASLYQANYMTIGSSGKSESSAKIFALPVCCWAIPWICMYARKGFKLIDTITWFLKCRLGWVNAPSVQLLFHLL